MDRIGKFFNDKEDLIAYCLAYYNVEDHDDIRARICGHSPFQLLQIFCLDSFTGDFNVTDYDNNTVLVIKNVEIPYYLDLIAQALEAGSVHLHDFDSTAPHVPFEFYSNKMENGQAKLFYSYTYFMSAIRESFVDAGAGIIEDAVGKIEACHVVNLPITIDCVDPLARDAKFEYGNTTVCWRQGRFEPTLSPVFFDLYTEGNWVKFQDEHTGLKMTKKVKGWSSKDDIVQPFSSEARGFVGNKQFVSYLKANFPYGGFDSCHNCRLFKALTLEFPLLNLTKIAIALTHLKVACTHIPGSKLYSRIENRSDVNGEQLAISLDYPQIKSRSYKSKGGPIIRIYTHEELMLFNFLRQNVDSVCEIGFKLSESLHHMNKEFFVMTGTPFYASPPQVEHSAFFVRVPRSSPLGYVNSHVVAVLESTEYDYYYLEADDDVPPLSIIPVNKGMSLRGNCKKTPCSIHQHKKCKGGRFVVECGGALCEQGGLFVWNYLGRWAVCRIVDTPTTLTKVHSQFDTFSFPYTDDVDQQKMLSIAEKDTVLIAHPKLGKFDAVFLTFLMREKVKISKDDAGILIKAHGLVIKLQGDDVYYNNMIQCDVVGVENQFIRDSPVQVRRRWEKYKEK